MVLLSGKSSIRNKPNPTRGKKASCFSFLFFSQIFFSPFFLFLGLEVFLLGFVFIVFIFVGYFSNHDVQREIDLLLHPPPPLEQEFVVQYDVSVVDDG